jgi:predicted metal-dependent peptidase
MPKKKRRVSFSLVNLALQKSTSNPNAHFCIYSKTIQRLRHKKLPAGATMAVGLDVRGYYFMYNPELLNEMDLKTIGIVLQHEVLHILLGHITRGLAIVTRTTSEKAKRKFMKVSAIAVDYAVNSLMTKWGVMTTDYLKTKMGPPLLDPKGDPVLDDQGRHLSKYAGLHPSDMDLPDAMSYEWYFREIMNNYDKFAEKFKSLSDMPTKIILILRQPGEGEGEPGEGEGEGEDESEGEGQGSGLEPGEDGMDVYIALHRGGVPDEVNEESVKDLDLSDILDAGDVGKDIVAENVRNAASEAKNRGVNPGNLFENVLAPLIYKPPISWKAIFRRFVASARSVHARKTYSKNRRRKPLYGAGPSRDILFKGKTRIPSWKVLFALDTSGSMSKTDILECLSTLQAMMQSSVELTVTVIEADTKIHKIYELESDTDIQLEVRGRGGTTFDESFAYAKEVLRPDLLIYATDGYAPLPHPNSRIPADQVLWLVTSQGCMPGFGYSGREQLMKHVLQTHPEYGRVLRVGK